MNCRICGYLSNKAFNNEILGKYKVDYYKCTACGYLFTETPFWLKEAYSNAIAKSDTGILARNWEFSRKLPILLYFIGCNLKNDRFIDYAGGGGILVRLMRDMGLDFFWHDKFCQNWVANGFEANFTTKYDGLTMFECLEHLAAPSIIMKSLAQLSDILIFSTQLLPIEIPDKSWWYYSFETGQHIGFYSKKTMSVLAVILQKHYYYLCGMHVFIDKALPKKIIFLLKMLDKYNFTVKILWKILKKKLQINGKTVADQQHLLNQTKYNGLEYT